MATTESPIYTTSVEEFEWNLKLILMIVSPEGIQLDTISDTYKKYLNENIDPSMLKPNSKYWTTIFQALPLLCKTFELFEHHELSCIYVKIRPVGNTSENIEDNFIKKVFLLANYKKASLLSTDKRITSFEEDEPTAAKRKRTICKSATQGTPDLTNSWKEQLNTEFTIVYKTTSEHYDPPRPRPRGKQLAQRYHGPTYPPWKVKSFLFSYKCKEKEWKHLCTQHYPNDYSCVIAWRDTVYEIGGTEYDVFHSGLDKPALSTVKIYKSGKETKGPNLIQPTMNASACIVKDSLYLIGGNHLELTLNTLQRLNLKQKDQDWILLKSMNRKRRNFGVAVVGSYIYAIGGDELVGRNEINIGLKSGEVYNTEKNSWENIPDMNSPTHYLKTCVLDNLIYAISGRSKCTMEQYNCELKTWKSMADLLPKHYIHRQVVVPSNNLIFLLGDAKMTANDESSKFMEVYDPRSNQWNTLPYEHYFDIRPDAEFITYFTN